jgi:gamma-tubulin complex component 2
MGALGTLVDETSALNGGVLLGKLFDLTKCSSDRQVTTFYAFLAERASIPYVAMLSHWLYEGEVTDVYGEFLIQERKSQQKSQLSSEFRDSYWETRFTLRTSIPTFLEKYKDVILRTGKYLNVVGESSKRQHNPNRELDYRSEELVRS